MIAYRDGWVAVTFYRSTTRRLCRYLHGAPQAADQLSIPLTLAHRDISPWDRRRPGPATFFAAELARPHTHS
ncbi:hypothetical protein GCM10017673_44480 [Streptosporangium violaceochromogenes]|nr:hypothetical protein GCM10017673_44480 [Streptosporangium violaceochromogenes]